MSLRVALGPRSYTITISESYAGLPRQLTQLDLPREGWVISHARLLAGKPGKELLKVLKRGGWAIQTLTIPEQETSKSLRMAERVIAAIVRRSSMRTPLLFALGGGVVGDLTGFVASILRRGVPYVQLPTTLLAQVDSGIGGKTGVDLPAAKNFIGTFYQPRAVWNHLGVLQTLPLRQRRSGLSEVIKYGVIGDPALFRLLEQRMKDCLALKPALMREVIERSCRIKARIVSLDERETKGIRHQLNYGHTLGHALEVAGRFRRWTHGEAIAIGMGAAVTLSAALGRCSENLVGRVLQLLEQAGLPLFAERVSYASVKQALRYDKKATRGRQCWVLPVRLGKVIVTDRVPEKLVQEILCAYVR